MAEPSNIYVKRSSSPVSAEILERIPFKRPRCYGENMKSNDDDLKSQTNQDKYETYNSLVSTDTTSSGKEVKKERELSEQSLDKMGIDDDLQEATEENDSTMTDCHIKSEDLEKKVTPAKPVTPLLDSVADKLCPIDNLILSGASGEERWRGMFVIVCM